MVERTTPPVPWLTSPSTSSSTTIARVSTGEGNSNTSLHIVFVQDAEPLATTDTQTAESSTSSRSTSPRFTPQPTFWVVRCVTTSVSLGLVLQHSWAMCCDCWCTRDHTTDAPPTPLLPGSPALRACHHVFRIRIRHSCCYKWTVVWVGDGWGWVWADAFQNGTCPDGDIGNSRQALPDVTLTRDPFLTVAVGCSL